MKIGEIHVDGVDKSFILPHEKRNSVKQLTLGFFKSSTTEKQQALKDISFDIKQGEFFGILGRNGSGKSTLLKILAGIYQPSAGTIETSGKVVPFIELGVGFNPELTGRENVYLNGALLGFSVKEINSMYDEIVEFAELERFMDQKLKNYSSGMQVRLAFAVATRSKADILLIDEVLAVGDADFQKKCFNYFRKLKSSDTTVVFVTHDMGAVREYCDRAVLIENSKIVKIGDAQHIASLYTKMFIKQDEEADSKGTVGEGRWGTKRATITSTSIKKRLYTEADKDITFEFAYQANKDIDDPVVGFMLKNISNQQLMGTNQRILMQEIIPCKAGSIVSIKFTIPNIFNTGTYFIEPSIVYNNDTEVGEWIEEAITFDVYKEARTPYLVNPDVGIVISTDGKT